MNNSPAHSDPETELERRLALAKSYQTKEELHDPVEDDREFEEILDKASKEAAAHFSPEDRGIGFCHQVWKKNHSHPIG